jgi:hypothetical protein
MARTLEERLQSDDPEPWIAEDVDDSVWGEIEEITQRESNYSEGSDTFVTLITPNGDVVSVAIWGTVLKKKFAELAPKEGDKIGFRFLGEQVPKSGGKPYKNWKVNIARATAPVGDGAATGDEFPEE